MKTRKLTFAALMLALAMVFFGLTFALPMLDLTLCAAASACVALTVTRSGVGYGVLGYTAMVILSFIILPDKSLVVMFALLFGPYPLLRWLYRRIRSKALRWVVRLTAVNVLVVAAYMLFSWAFADVVGPWWQMAAFLLAYNALMLLYDAALGRIEMMLWLRVK